ncbi:hypothetical protein [Spirosoma koreense]
MNRRLHPDDLNSSPYQELIQSLVFQWVHAGLPTKGLTQADYLRDIRTLLLTTQSPARTETIVRAVLGQAATLGKTAVWVEQELKFEGMVEGADRNDFLRFELSQAPELDDRLLDSYNERINRFSAQNTTGQK